MKFITRRVVINSAYLADSAANTSLIKSRKLYYNGVLINRKIVLSYRGRYRRRFPWPMPNSNKNTARARRVRLHALSASRRSYPDSLRNKDGLANVKEGKVGNPLPELVDSRRTGPRRFGLRIRKIHQRRE